AARQAVGGVSGATLLVLNSVRLASLVVLPIVVTFLTRGSTFIGLWMGPALAPGSGRVLSILALGLCVFSSYQVLTSSMMALDLQRPLVPAYVGEAVLNLGLSVVLGYAIGVDGVAWGTTIPRVILSIAASWYAWRYFKVSFLDYAINAW